MKVIKSYFEFDSIHHFSKVMFIIEEFDHAFGESSSLRTITIL